MNPERASCRKSGSVNVAPSATRRGWGPHVKRVDRPELGARSILMSNATATRRDPPLHAAPCVSGKLLASSASACRGRAVRRSPRSSRRAPAAVRPAARHERRCASGQMLAQPSCRTSPPRLGFRHPEPPGCGGGESAASSTVGAAKGRERFQPQWPRGLLPASPPESRVSRPRSSPGASRLASSGGAARLDAAVGDEMRSANIPLAPRVERVEGPPHPPTSPPARATHYAPARDHLPRAPPRSPPATSPPPPAQHPRPPFRESGGNLAADDLSRGYASRSAPSPQDPPSRSPSKRALLYLSRRRVSARRTRRREPATAPSAANSAFSAAPATHSLKPEIAPNHRHPPPSPAGRQSSNANARQTPPACSPRTRFFPSD